MRKRPYSMLCKSLLVLTLLLFLKQDNANACQATPKPACERSVWLTVLTPGNVAIPQNGQINIPMIFLPYVFWNTAQGCAQPTLTGDDPTRSALTLNIMVQIQVISVSTGNMTDLGMRMFDAPAPTSPGQVVVKEDLVIPDGQLDRNDAYIAVFNAKVTVTFGAGTGMGTLMASATAQAYLVQPAPGFPNIPRVNVEYLPVMDNDPGFRECRRGDLALMYFLVSNNDLVNSVELELSTLASQVAGFPDGFDNNNAFNGGVFRISDPSDVFPHAFRKKDEVCALLPDDNPTSLTKQMSLSAGRSRIIAIAMQSYGKCSNGSCNKLVLFAEGQFSDGSAALACASTALLVGDVPAKSVRNEFLDLIKTSDNAITCYSDAIYYAPGLEEIPHASTHFNGNVVSTQGVRGWWLYGVNTTSDPGMYNMMSDRVRIEGTVEVYAISFGLSYSGQTGTAQNVVLVSPVPTEVGSEVVIPVIKYLPFPLTQILIKPDKDSIFVYHSSTGELVFSGKYSTFLQSPPTQFMIDHGSCRVIRRISDLSDRVICPGRHSVNRLHKRGDDPRHSFEVVDQFGTPLQGTMTVIDGAIGPPTQNFNGTVEYDLLKTVISASPIRNKGRFEINVPGTLSSVSIPYAVAKFDRLSYLITNELELAEALQVIQARRGHVDLRFSSPRQNFVITKVPALPYNRFYGDDINIDQGRSPGSAVVVIDGSGCPAPCDIFTFEGDDNQINNLQLINFPQNALTLIGDNNLVASCIFQDNGGSGVVVAEGINNTISQGSFINNGMLGIDLGGDGVTANDPMDVDTGANNLQNFPVLTRASVDVGGGTFIQGMISSTPITMLTLQFYTSTACSPSGFGEGISYIAEMQVMTDAQGDATFEFTAGPESAMNDFITATATDPDGNTSEFSECKEVLGTTAVKDAVNVNGLRVYPNPVSDLLNIELDLDKATDVVIDIMNSYGVTLSNVHRGSLPAGVHTVNLSTDRLPDGLYLMRVRVGVEEEIVKVVVQ